MTIYIFVLLTILAIILIANIVATILYFFEFRRLKAIFREAPAVSICTDGSYEYVGSVTTPARVVKIDANTMINYRTMRTVATWTGQSGDKLKEVNFENISTKEN